jgi:hypothetical protein
VRLFPTPGRGERGVGGGEFLVVIVVTRAQKNRRSLITREREVGWNRTGRAEKREKNKNPRLYSNREGFSIDVGRLERGYTGREVTRGGGKRGGGERGGRRK